MPYIHCEAGYVMVSCGCMDRGDYDHECLGTRMSLMGDIYD